MLMVQWRLEMDVMALGLELEVEVAAGGGGAGVADWSVEFVPDSAFRVE